MSVVNTVTGSVSTKELGKTLVHEHLLLRSEIVTFQFPHLYNEEAIYKRAIDAVNKVKEHGVKTICDPTVVGIGRDVRFLEKVSKETGVQVVTATGIYTFTEIPTYFQNRSIDFMADVFIRDIEVGIQGTNIKAGFLKCAADVQGITEDVEKVFRAVARAQIKTGVPIMTHSHPASKNGYKQLEIFKEEGVNPNAIMIGHTGDTDDVEYVHNILDSGVFIGADRFGQGPLEYDKRHTTLVGLLNEGYTNKIFLSQDFCCTVDWFPSDVIHELLPDWSITFLFDEVIPDLKQAGVSEEQIKTMMVDNVIDWFECK